MNEKGTGVMTQAEELRELRREMREDIKGLYKRMDARESDFNTRMNDFVSSNNEGHQQLNDKLSAIAVNTAIVTTKNTMKITLFVTGLCIFVTVIANNVIAKMFI